MEIPAGVSFFYANNEPKSALARDLGDCRDNKGKLAKRVFTCLYPEFTALFWNVILAKDMKYGNISSDSEPAVLVFSADGVGDVQIYLIYENERERM